MTRRPSARNSAATAQNFQDADVVTNVALLRYAEASKLAKAWLKGSFPDGSNVDDHRDPGGLDAEEAKIFGGHAVNDYSETYVHRFLIRSSAGPLRRKDPTLTSSTVIRSGVGYHPPVDSKAAPASSSARAASDSPATAFLRRQLLRDGDKRRPLVSSTARPRQGGHTSRPAAAARIPHDSSDEDDSRSAMRKSKARETAKAAQTGPSHSNTDTIQVQPQSSETGPPDSMSRGGMTFIAHEKPTKQRGTSYLDEILAARAAKKRKKKG